MQNAVRIKLARSHDVKGFTVDDTAIGNISNWSNDDSPTRSRVDIARRDAVMSSTIRGSIIGNVAVEDDAVRGQADVGRADRHGDAVHNLVSGAVGEGANRCDAGHDDVFVCVGAARHCIITRAATSSNAVGDDVSSNDIVSAGAVGHGVITSNIISSQLRLAWYWTLK